MAVEFRQTEVVDTDAFRAALYRKAGFVGGRKRMAILIDGTCHDEIIMARSKDSTRRRPIPPAPS